MYFGLMAIARFGNLGKATSSGIQRVAFLAVVRKITLTLAVISTFALLRLILLGVKSASLGNASTDRTFTTPVFPLYGVLWFLLSGTNTSRHSLSILCQHYLPIEPTNTLPPPLSNPTLWRLFCCGFACQIFCLEGGPPLR